MQHIKFEWFTNCEVLMEESQPERGLYTMYLLDMERTVVLDANNEYVLGLRGRPLSIQKDHGRRYTVVGTNVKGIHYSQTVAIDGWLERLRDTSLDAIAPEDKCNLAMIGLPRLTICRDGGVWSSIQCIWLQPQLNKGAWYVHTSVYNHEDKKYHNNQLGVHYMLAAAFVPNPNGYKYVQFKDGDTWNLEISNLEWSPKVQRGRSRNYWHTVRQAILNLKPEQLAQLTQK